MDRYLYIDGVRHVIDYDSSTGNYTVLGESDLPADAVVSGYPELVTVTKDHYMSDDTNVTIEEVYNQLQLTCEQDEIEDLIESPLDEDSIYSPFTNKQHYCTELIGTKLNFSAFLDLIYNGTSKSDDAKIHDWYIQVYKSKNWEFNGDKFISSDNTNQWKVLQRARAETELCFLCAFGKQDTGSLKDNTIKPAPEMKTYLVIGVNGNRVDEEARLWPSETALQQNSPLATYKGNLTGGYFSPTDDATTNYIVISGKMVLCSSQQHSLNSATNKPESDIYNTYYDGYKNVNVYEPDPNKGKLFDYPTIKEMSPGELIVEFLPLGFGSNANIYLKDDWGPTFYTVKFYDNPTPSSDDIVRTEKKMESLYPWNSEYDKLEELPYGWSSNGSEEDKYWMLPVLECTLKIGDKYCCQINGADPEAFPTYKWLTYDQCPVLDGVKMNHIWIGPNPKIDDKFVGKEYDIFNMVNAQMNIDGKGIAIPIKQSDKLSGKVEFTIDGTCNLTYDQITRKHPSFWRHTSWLHDTKQVLGHVSQILISDFGIKVYSDNASINNIEEDKDLVYMTDEATTDFINKKDDIDFKLATGLTTEECAEKRIRQSVKMNTPFIGEEPLRSVYNMITHNSGKPEEQYLTNYYREYTSPKMLIETTLHEDLGYDFLTHYQFPTLPGKEFMINNITKNVKDCSDTITVKEL